MGTTSLMTRCPCYRTLHKLSLWWSSTMGIHHQDQDQTKKGRWLWALTCGKGTSIVRDWRIGQRGKRAHPKVVRDVDGGGTLQLHAVLAYSSKRWRLTSSDWPALTVCATGYMSCSKSKIKLPTSRPPAHPRVDITLALTHLPPAQALLKWVVVAERKAKGKRERELKLETTQELLFVL